MLPYHARHRQSTRPAVTRPSPRPAEPLTHRETRKHELDQTIVNVALPTIHHSLGFSQSGLAWVVDAYLIGFGALLMLAGRLGDLLGRRSVFLVGLVVFTLGSLWCG